MVTSVQDTPEIRLEKLHKRLRLVHGSLEEEYPEQLMAAQFVPADAYVLEIGGNVGRNSCVLGALLNNSSHLVVLECDPDSVRMLRDNRDANNLSFFIETAALSKRPIIASGWDSKPLDGDSVPNGWQRVDTIPWDDFRRKYPLPFDTLVLDCEGAIYHILQDEPNLLAGFRRVLIENDFHTIEHKEFVDDQLKRHGFSVAYSRDGGWGPCSDYFFQTWTR